MRAWSDLGDLLSPKGRVSSDALRDGFRVTFKDEIKGRPFSVSVTTETFMESIAVVTILVKEAQR